MHSLHWESAIGGAVRQRPRRSCPQFLHYKTCIPLHLSLASLTEGLIRGDTRGCCLSLVSKPRFSGHEYACVLSGKIMKKIYWKEISLCKSRCLASGYFARETFLFLEVFHLKGSYWICKKNRLDVFFPLSPEGRECVWAFFRSWVLLGTHERKR